MEYIIFWLFFIHICRCRHIRYLIEYGVGLLLRIFRSGCCSNNHSCLTIAFHSIIGINVWINVVRCCFMNKYQWDNYYVCMLYICMLLQEPAAAKVDSVCIDVLFIRSFWFIAHTLDSYYPFTPPYRLLTHTSPMIVDKVTTYVFMFVIDMNVKYGWTNFC